jgi:DNA polymerase III subunit delta'
MIGHQKQWNFLKRKFEQGQLSHAYLFAGEKGIGKRTLAKEIVEFVGCKFPDLMVVEPEDGKEISIAKIREVQNFLSYKSYYSLGIKSVIVNDAEKMNQEAQSCFLKTLEEPKGRTLIILVSSMPAMLLPTIFSRCQTIKFFRPKNFQPEEKAILPELLEIINSDFSEKFKYVKSLDFEKQKIGDILETLQKYFRRLLLEKVQAGEDVLKIKKDIELIEDINNKLLFANANPKLALEILLMEI